jgi:hypothetical protein
MTRLFAIVFWALLLAATAQRVCAQVPVDSTTALARARGLRPHVSAADPGPLWVVFNETMREAMGDSTRFAAAMTGIHAQVGAILEVVSEEMVQERGYWMYRALCRFEKAPEPLQLFVAIAPDGRVAGLAVRPGEKKEFPSTKLDYQTKTTLHLPFKGEWFVYWGGRTLAENHHATSKSQRFALDLAIVKDDSTRIGDGSRLTDYHCYGVEILAPAAGAIAWSCDSLPDQEPGTMDPDHPVGNGVVIDHGNGEFSLMAHLQPRTQRFKVGDRVKTGEVLGLCGNSGNTSEPHLHYHLQDGPDIRSAEGLPAVFVGLCVDGKPVPKAEPVRGQKIKRCP